MSRNVEAFSLNFRNGGTFKVDAAHVGDVWIKRISNSIGRINGSDIVEISPAEGLKIEILPEADTFQEASIDLGGLETGMFDAISRARSVESMTLTWDNGEADQIFFPFEPLDEDGIENRYMSSKVGKNGHLYIVIDKEWLVSQVYKHV